jgi:uncharacterized protein
MEIEVVDMQQENVQKPQEEGVEIPFERIDPDTLRVLISEFVTREWEELGATSFTLDDKIAQVQRQLKERSAAVVFDLSSSTANIVARR